MRAAARGALVIRTCTLWMVMVWLTVGCASSGMRPGSPLVLELEALTLHTYPRLGAGAWRHGLRATLHAHDDALTHCLQGLLASDRRTLLALTLDADGQLTDVGVHVGLRLTPAPRASACLTEALAGHALAESGPARMLIPVRTDSPDERALLLVGLSPLHLTVPLPPGPLGRLEPPTAPTSEIPPEFANLWRGLETHGARHELTACEDLTQRAARVELGDAESHTDSCAAAVLRPFGDAAITVYASTPPNEAPSAGLIFGSAHLTESFSQQLSHHTTALTTCYALAPEAETLELEIDVELATGRVLHVLSDATHAPTLLACLESYLLETPMLPHPGAAGAARVVAQLTFEPVEPPAHPTLRDRARELLWQQGIPSHANLLENWLTHREGLDGPRLLALLQAYHEVGARDLARRLGEELLDGQLLLPSGGFHDVWLASDERLGVLLEVLRLTCEDELRPERCVLRARQLHALAQAQGADASLLAAAASAVWESADRLARLDKREASRALLDTYAELAPYDGPRGDIAWGELWTHLGELEAAALAYERYGLESRPLPYDAEDALSQALALRSRRVNATACPSVPLPGVRMSLPDCVAQLITAVDAYGWRVHYEDQLSYGAEAARLVLRFGDGADAASRYERLSDFVEDGSDVREVFGGWMTALETQGRHAEQFRVWEDMSQRESLRTLRFWHHYHTLLQYRFCLGGPDFERWDGTSEERHRLCYEPPQGTSL